MGTSDPLKPASEAEFNVWERAPGDAELDGWIARWTGELKGQRILDVGCGEGHLLAALKRHGYDAQGVELSSELALSAKARGLNVAAGDAVRKERQNRQPPK